MKICNKLHIISALMAHLKGDMGRFLEPRTLSAVIPIFAVFFRLWEESFVFFKRRVRNRSRHNSVETLEKRVVPAVIWAAGPALPVAEAQTAAVQLGASSYLFGGGGSTVEVHADGATGWTQAAPTDGAPLSPGAGLAGGLVVFGGNDGGVVGITTNYDPTDNNTTDGGNLGTARWRMAYATDSGSIYAIGGEDANGAALASVERYNGSSWALVHALPTALIGAAAIDDGAGHIYVFGGIPSMTSAPSSSVYKYTVASDSWSEIGSMPTAVVYEAAVLGFNGNVYLLGGSTSSGAAAAGDTAKVQVFNINSNIWASETPLPAAVSSESAVLDSQGRLLVIGGINSSGSAVANVSVSQQLNVPVAPPVFTSAPVTTASADRPYTYTATVSSNPSATFSLVSGPGGMTVNSTTGVVTWQPLSSQVGTQSVDIRATNVAGSVNQTFIVATKLESVPPSIPTNFHQISATINSMTLGWTASNDPYGVAGYRIYYTYGHSGRGGGSTTVLFYTSVGSATTATIGGLPSGKGYNLAIAAYNSSGYQSARSSYLGATTYSLPTLYVPTVAVSATANHPLSLTLSTTGIPAPTIRLQNLPANMSFNATTGILSWTPTPAQVGSYTITAVATSAAGTTTKPFTINVGADVPVLSYLINGTTGPNYGLVGQPMTIQILNDSLTTTTYKLVSGSTNVKLNSSTGLITFTPAESDAGQDTIVITGTNAVGQATLNATLQTYITPGVTNIMTTNTTLLNPTISWTAPAGNNVANIAGYQISLQGYGPAGYTTPITFNVRSPAITSIQLTGLAQGLYYYTPTITPYDSAGMLGLAATGTNFSYVPNLPNLSYTGSPTQTVVGQPLSLTLTNSNTSLPVTYGLLSGTSNISVNPITGVVSWVPTFAQEGTQTVTFSATNSVGTVTQTLNLGVVPFNGPSSATFSNLTSSSFNVNWQPPTLNAKLVAGYHITVYVGNTHSNYTTNPSTLTLPVSAGAHGYVYVIWITAFDANNVDGAVTVLDVPFS